MKTRTLAFLGAVAVAAAANAETTSGFIFCSAKIMEANDNYLSVSLPATEGYVDANGNPVTLWRIGEVVAGGAVDTFYSDKGPGAFQVRNTGSVPAYLYVTSGALNWNSWLYQETDAHRADDSRSNTHDVDGYVYKTFSTVFGNEFVYARCVPAEHWMDDGVSYRLAVSTAVTSKLPVWRDLDRCSNASATSDSSPSGYGEWHAAGDADFSGRCGQYLSYLLPGEVQPFDLKFWAPKCGYDETIVFPIVIEASSFKRWDHDK